MHRILLMLILLGCTAAYCPSVANEPDQYNVVWETPSQDAAGSMPLGNGDISLNAWVEPDGDLRFYIGKTDTWGDNGRLLKVGCVRISLDPAPRISAEPLAGSATGVAEAARLQTEGVSAREAAEPLAGSATGVAEAARLQTEGVSAREAAEPLAGSATGVAEAARLQTEGVSAREAAEPLAGSVAALRQTLRLSDATMVAEFGQGDQAVVVQLWVDANQPVIHVKVESQQPIVARAQIELWRKTREELKQLEVSDVLLNRSKPEQHEVPVFVEPDTMIDDLTDAIGWYHHNSKSVGPSITGKTQGVSGFAREDPLLNRTFGALVLTEDGQRIDATTLTRPQSSSHRFDIYVLTRHPALPAQWRQSIDELVTAVTKTPFAQRLEAHQQWWHRFWNRSWIDISLDAQATISSLVPPNTHAVQIGVDQHQQNRFQGELGRVRLLGTPLDDQTIRRLAVKENRLSESELPNSLYQGVPEIGLSIPNSQTWDFAAGLAIEAWVKPEQLPGGGGRIVDKVTPGGGDGFLLDTFPGNSLRLIVGQRQLTSKDALPVDRWTHVAATIDNRADRIALYVNGELVAEESGPGLDDARAVSQMYALQRFIDACAGRGSYPIKFNGSIFTVPYPGAPGDADYRRWGPGYWWQNTRLPYTSMCTSGDFEMMRPLFHMYAEELMPLQKYRTKLYLGHAGAYIPECIYFWGDVFTESYGWTPFEERTDKLQESGWHKWEWVSGPELVWMMLDYYEHTLDGEFLQRLLLPTAHEILTFFDQHYQPGPDGKLVMHPSQALETWWDTTNPMPELAGLQAVTARLLTLPSEVVSPAQRSFLIAFQGKLPPLPTREIDGQQALAPAARFDLKRNIENPELYAVFPFRLVSFEKPNAQLGLVALQHRADRGNIGWRQDDVFMAYLGLSREAQEHIVGRARQHDPRSRFPAFWGPNYDWVPDQDHGGILMKAVQCMLLQTDGKHIYLFPAWPADWNVQFKLHAPYRTVVEGEYRQGKVTRLTVTPQDRQQDVVICGEQASQ